MYLVRDIPAFVMYYAYGASRSSPLIESTDSMIYTTLHTIAALFIIYVCDVSVAYITWNNIISYHDISSINKENVSSSVRISTCACKQAIKKVK